MAKAKLSSYEMALKLAQKRHPDLDKVASLLEDALAEGDVEAAYALGTWFLHGKHFKANKRKAIQHLTMAARGGVKDACYDLAICYEKGVGVAQNLPKAAELYLRAVLAGDEQSIYEMGRCYYYGIGVEKDRRIARVWLDRARELGVD